MDIVGGPEAHLDTSHQCRLEERAEGTCWFGNVDDAQEEDRDEDARNLVKEFIGFRLITHFESVCLVVHRFRYVAR